MIRLAISSNSENILSLRRLLTSCPEENITRWHWALHCLCHSTKLPRGSSIILTLQSISGTSGCQWMSQAPTTYVLRSTPVQPITLKTVNGSQARPEKEDRPRTNKFSLWNLPSFGCNFPADIKQLSRCVYWPRNGGPARQHRREPWNLELVSREQDRLFTVIPR